MSEVGTDVTAAATGAAHGEGNGEKKSAESCVTYKVVDTELTADCVEAVPSAFAEAAACGLFALGTYQLNTETRVKSGQLTLFSVRAVLVLTVLGVGGGCDTRHHQVELPDSSEGDDTADTADTTAPALVKGRVLDTSALLDAKWCAFCVCTVPLCCCCCCVLLLASLVDTRLTGLDWTGIGGCVSPNCVAFAGPGASSEASSCWARLRSRPGFTSFRCSAAKILRLYVREPSCIAQRWLPHTLTRVPARHVSSAPANGCAQSLKEEAVTSVDADVALSLVGWAFVVRTGMGWNEAELSVVRGVVLQDWSTRLQAASPRVSVSSSDG